MNNSTVRQFLKIMLISGSIFISALILLLIIIGWRYQSSIKNLVIENLKNKIHAELQIGDIRLNLIRNFPLASVSASDVFIHEANNMQNNFEFHAETIKLQFNILDILKKKYIITQLTLNNGSFNSTAGEEAVYSNLFSKNNDAAEQTKVHFDIRRILINDVDLTLADHRSDINARLKIKKARVTGHFSEKKSYKARGKIDAKEFLHAGFCLPEIVSVEFDLNIDIAADGTWLANNCNLSWDGQHLTVNGSFGTHSGSLWTNASLDAQHLDIERWIAFIPENTQKKLHAYNPTGNLDLKATIKHCPEINATPHIHCSFNLHNASLIVSDHNISMKNLVAQGYYTNGHKRTSSGSILNIHSFSAYVNGNKNNINGNLRIEDFVQPLLSLYLKANITAPDLLTLTGIENISAAKGRAAIEMGFSGNMNKNMGFDSDEILAANIEGNIRLNNVSFIVNDNQYLKYHDFNGDLLFLDNRLVVEGLSGKAGDSDFRFAGFVDDLIPYLLLPDQEIYVETHMHSNKIVLDELLQQNAASGDTFYRLRIPKRLKLNINASINELGFKRFFARNIRGNALLSEQVVNAGELRFEAMDGKINMTGIIDGSNENELWVHTGVSLENLDINKLFYQTGNFGQTAITHDNIYGLTDANLNFSAKWNKRLSIDWESMETTANIRIVDGRMLNYNPLIALGRYIRTDNLDTVSFSALENKIHIKNRMISIPMMEVSSNVLDLKLSGMHSFDNHIDYRLRVLLSDLMARRHRERRNPQEQYGEIIDDGLGQTTLFLRLSGTAQNPVFRYDRENHADQMRNNIIEERQNLREILRDEFSFLNRQNNDSINNQPDERQLERQQIKQQEKNGFIIEWD